MAISINPSVAGVNQGGRRYLYQSYSRVTAPALAAEQLALSVLIPAGTAQIGRRLRMQWLISKSGTTDAVTAHRLRIGSTNTSADAVIFNQAAILAANRAAGLNCDLSIQTATQVRQVTHSIALGLEAGAVSNVVMPTNFTVSNLLTTDYYIGLYVHLAGTTDTVTIENLSIELT